MNTTAKIQHKSQVTIPSRVRERAGLSKGDVVEFSYQHGRIVITPKLVIDRSQFSTADGEYTSAQRRVIDARLAEALGDIKAGRTHGLFETHAEMMAFLKKKPRQSRERKSKRSKK